MNATEQVKTLRKILNEPINIDMPAPWRPPEPPEPPRPKPFDIEANQPDELEDALVAWDEHDRAVSALLLARVNWEKDLKAIEAADSATDAEVDRMGRISAELELVPRKLQVLGKRGQTIKKRLQRCYGCRFFSLQALARTIFEEQRQKAIAFLLPKCERDQDAAYQAAMLLPSVKRAIEGCDAFAYISTTDVVTGSRQLLAHQKTLVEAGRALMKK